MHCTRKFLTIFYQQGKGQYSWLVMPTMWHIQQSFRISLHNFAYFNQNWSACAKFQVDFFFFSANFLVCWLGKSHACGTAPSNVGFLWDFLTWMGCGTLRPATPFGESLCNVRPTKNLHISLFHINHTFVNTADQYRVWARTAECSFWNYVTW